VHKENRIQNYDPGKTCYVGLYNIYQSTIPVMLTVNLYDATSKVKNHNS